ncbi:MAG: tRNA pseudouridine(13) synthase TruD [Anaerolineales bacterium]|nr:tRNA pseudouridine(13) synthase TruD [Anaerolineales bacterium]
MRIKHIPADFIVKEKLGLNSAASGAFTLYKVEKTNITTLQVHTKIASTLKYPRSAIKFAGLKDRRAVATQYATIRGNPPQSIDGNGFRAVYYGKLDRPLRSTDISHNHFSIVLRDLSPEQAQHIIKNLQVMVDNGLPNYFHHQRFGSFNSSDGFIGAHILARDAERAIKSYLAIIYPGDPTRIKQFKKVAAANWGDWKTIFKAAPKPSNYRSLLTFLCDHPDDFRRAINLAPRELVSLWLDAYQSYLWNRIVGQYIVDCPEIKREDLDWIEMAGKKFPIYRDLSAGLLEEWRQHKITLPHHRAIYYPPELARVVDSVLQDENFSINDLKARIMKKAYTSRHSRSLLLFPQEIHADEPEDDDCFPGRKKIIIDFSLPRGTYATLVIECANIHS